MATRYSVDLKVGDGKTMTASDFAMLMQYLTPSTTGTLYGCKVTKKDTLSVKVATGWVVVCGRIVKVNAGTLSITTANLPTTASKKVTYYVQVAVSLLNGTAYAQISKTKGTTTSDATSQTSGDGYHTIATVTIGNKGVETITNTARMKTVKQRLSSATEESEKKVTIAKNKSAMGLASNVTLNKVGDTVVCTIERTGEVKYSNKETEVLTIPSGWRPKANVYGYYSGVSGANIPVSNSFGRYRVSSSGKLYELTNFKGAIERKCTMVWVTD